VAQSESRRTSGILALLMGPVFALIAFLGGLLTAQTRGARDVWKAFYLASVLYATGLALSILPEYDSVEQAASRRRLLVAMLALLGVGFSLVPLMSNSSAWNRIWAGVFMLAPSAAILVSRPSDRIRALTFIVMACANHAVIYAAPLFISATPLFFALGVYCALRNVIRPPLKARAVLQIISAAAALGVSSVGLTLAYRARSIPGIFVFAFGIMAFGSLSILRLVLGDYWWLRGNRS
jgi:hypothetical protein